jgi:hypothetical protein
MAAQRRFDIAEAAGGEVFGHEDTYALLIFIRTRLHYRLID